MFNEFKYDFFNQYIYIVGASINFKEHYVKRKRVKISKVTQMSVSYN